MEAREKKAIGEILSIENLIENEIWRETIKWDGERRKKEIRKDGRKRKGKQMKG